MFQIIYKILWAIATSFILLAGFYFTKVLYGKQFHFLSLCKAFHRNKENKTQINSFDTLMLTLAGRIGVGSIAGIALGIYIGGIGSLFWVWVTTFIVAILSYVETILGMKYREMDDDGHFIGGPSYYIKKGLKKEKLSLLYAILIIVCYIGGFLGIQSNTIAKSLIEIIPISQYVISLIVVAITAICIFGGVSTITKITSKLVPLMTILYLILFGYIICVYNTQIVTIVWNIITDAFDIKSFFGGFLSTCIIGLQRGIFSNEAGLGTGCIAASTSESTDIELQAKLQIIGVYITSLLICTATAFFILTSDYMEVSFDDINGIELMQYAFAYHFGISGQILLFLFIFLFAFSTILTGYYYGESSFRFILGKNHTKTIFLLKSITLLVLFFGSIMSPTILWKIIDCLVALLAIINIYAMICLRDNIF